MVVSFVGGPIDGLTLASDFTGESEYIVVDETGGCYRRWLVQQHSSSYLWREEFGGEAGSTDR